MMLKPRTVSGAVASINKVIEQLRHVKEVQEKDVEKFTAEENTAAVNKLLAKDEAEKAEKILSKLEALLK